MATEHVVFVRGGKTHESLPWMFFHFHPTQGVLPSAVKLSFFDYPNKKLQVWNNWRPKRSRAAPTSPNHEEELRHQVHVRQSDMTLDTSEKLPSVLALYEYIKKQPKGSIASLQVFSHGDYDGPILWNHSFENSDKNDLSKPRDAHDTEFRRRDFFGGNPLAGGEGRKFAEAFSPGNALVKIWGCTEDVKYRLLLRKMLRQRNDTAGKIRQIDMLDDYLDILDVIYALNLSRLLKVPVWSAPVGWGSNPWGELKYRGRFPPNIKTERWWVIPAFVSKYRQIYRSRLGAPLDATRFVGYSNGWMSTARSSLAADKAALLAGP